MLQALIPHKNINEISVKDNMNAEKPVSHIQTCKKHNSITFKMQKNEQERDGCGIEEVLEVGKILVHHKYVEKHEDNVLDALYHMKQAIKALQAPRVGVDGSLS